MGGITSNKSKQEWNAAHYAQIKISVNPELAAVFKSKCAASGVSMASVLVKFMGKYTKSTIVPKPCATYCTRRLRRAGVNRIIRQLYMIKSAEENYNSNIPANLRESINADNSDEAIAVIEDVIEQLESAY